MCSLSQCQASSSHVHSEGYLELAILFFGAVRLYPIFFFPYNFAENSPALLFDFHQTCWILLWHFWILYFYLFPQADLTQILSNTLSNYFVPHLDLSRLPHSNLRPPHARYYDLSFSVEETKTSESLSNWYKVTLLQNIGVGIIEPRQFNFRVRTLYDYIILRLWNWFLWNLLISHSSICTWPQPYFDSRLSVRHYSHSA